MSKEKIGGSVNQLQNCIQNYQQYVQLYIRNIIRLQMILERKKKGL